ncbi:response regulator transcription factor [Pedobacter nyackensis]|uniref:response regulator transcription factor n=1 Tax=Pedobacter nyackensis TaxID=475255 RepID=UPI00292D828E|nr:response regulator [Pedobacter nyackensis]
MDKCVYLVEDDSDIAYIIQFLLNEEEINVIAFSTIKSFKNFNSHHLPDLFILDVSLPDGNGMQLCNDIKASSKYQNIPVLMLSAHCNTDVMKKNTAANAYISKPFNLDHLLSTVNRLIEKQYPQ